ncbi:MAG: phosphatase PAP2 family protein [Planctomycetaceae bacterium]
MSVGSIIGLMLIIKAMVVGDPVAIMVATAVLVWLVTYGFLIKIFEPESVVRIITNSLTVCLFYGYSGRIISLINRPDFAPALLAWDRRLFGESPAVSLQASASPLMNEILSAGYLSYHVYLIWFLIHLLRLPVSSRITFARPLFTAFSLGFTIYFLMPAAGIADSFPDLFHRPVEGFRITALTQSLVATMAAKYDSFPSMHVFVTGVMLCVDFVNFRVRFWSMLVPSILMVFSTILLRMHFTVDTIVSFIMLVPFVWHFVRRN